MERGSPTREASCPPRRCLQPGCRCLAEPRCPPAVGGRDCRAGERNQSREETNNLLCPLRRCWRSSAALLQALCLPVETVTSGEGCIPKKGFLILKGWPLPARGTFSYRKKLFRGMMCRVRAKVSNADEHLDYLEQSCRHAAAELWPVARGILSPWDSRSMFATRIAAGFENSLSNASISSLSFYGFLCAAQQPNREYLVLCIPAGCFKRPHEGPVASPPQHAREVSWHLFRCV